MTAPVSWFQQPATGPPRNNKRIDNRPRLYSVPGSARAAATGSRALPADRRPLQAGSGALQLLPRPIPLSCLSFSARRRRYAALWRSLIFSDVDGIKRHSRSGPLSAADERVWAVSCPGLLLERQASEAARVLPHLLAPEHTVSRCSAARDFHICLLRSELCREPICIPPSCRRAMNAGDMYPLFAAMLTTRPWDQAREGQDLFGSAQP